jgi:hypothetical protein
VTQLPVVPAGCTLSADGVVAQRSRAAILQSSVETVERSAAGFRVVFGASVDRDLVAELVETERGCCSFLDIAWDGRVLAVESSDRAAVAALAGFFEGSVA